jgi:hypothetical protein
MLEGGEYHNLIRIGCRDVLPDVGCHAAPCEYHNFIFI